MKPSTPPRLGLSLVALSAGCFEGGQSVQIEPFEGPAILVTVHEDSITQRLAIDPKTGAPPVVTDAESQLFLVRALPDALTLAHTNVDASRIDELTFVDAPAGLSECAEGVVMDDGPRPGTDYALTGLTEIFEVKGAELVRLEPWPEALDQLALRAPSHPCSAAPASVHPFGADSPIIKLGDRLFNRPEVLTDFEGTDLRFAFYADVDTAVIGLAQTLVALPRSMTLEDAQFIDLVDPNRSLLTAPGLDSFMLQAAKRPVVEPGTDLRLLLLIGHEEPGTAADAGFSVFDVTVSEGHFQSSRLLYRSASGRGLAGRIAAGEGDDFLLSMDDRVLYFRRSAELVIDTPADTSAYTVALSERDDPNLSFTLRPMGWLEASASAPERYQLHQPPRGDPIYDYCGELFWNRDMPEPRLYAGCSQPAVFERSPEGWLERPLWFSAELGSCTASVRRCGRAPANFRFQVEHMSSAPDRELAYLLRGCPALLLAPLSGDRCGRHVEIDVEAFRNREQDIRLTRLDRLGNRILVAGDSGLLVEVELE